ncbi:DUF2309 domain-containing protein [Thalassotalea ponticola]|uniref:YbcC family protein n=1 Tax=Thalassotalea ponticola TaxID=1523392 RepID=UPI0025B4D8DE|nr:DUF2309 domain-containing protein [Thalassotalea ponticola]MDN3652369.1 DUF2309 domain-containing protein [Thalassotalea ponticola]
MSNASVSKTVTAAEDIGATIDDVGLEQAITSVCNSIAPTWPLDQMIAVNPYWSLVDKPFSQVAHHLALFAGSNLTMSLAYYGNLWRQGEITEPDVRQALAQLTDDDSRERLTAQYNLDAIIDAVSLPEQSLPTVPLLCDALDAHRDLQHQPAWCDTITHQIAQFCAAYFDQDQADWHPNDTLGLYQSWRETLAHDHSVALLMKAPDIASKARKLAATPRLQIAQALQQLNVPTEQWRDYLQAIIYRIGGWAAWCAYRQFQADLQQQDSDELVHLLAIRLSWECLIDDNIRHARSLWQYWQNQWQQHFATYQPNNTDIKLIWQRAHELSYQRHLAHVLSSSPVNKRQPQQPAQALPHRPRVQAAFCIDVRSEVYRRHFEAQGNDIQTLGFAGFFGLPIRYNPIGSDAKIEHLPGLFASSMAVCDSTGCDQQDKKIAAKRQQALAKKQGWKAFVSAPTSAFTLVETLGLSYVAKLVKHSLPRRFKPQPTQLGLSKAQMLKLSPMLNVDVGQQLELAKNILSAMGLSDNIAPIVLLVGHGSENINNPQKAGLDCGACCGQTGDVNARALAHLLNSEAVRQGLKAEHIDIPSDTKFIAALHNTTTDEVTLYDTHFGDVADTEIYNQHLSWLTKSLAKASKLTRQERAQQLGLQGLVSDPEKLAQAFSKRATDWSQTQPEWGLANNAAFIVAPRHRTQGLNLNGRTFLHDYQSERDEDASLLTQIMTAPMVVTNWINMQYYASTVDNSRYGSGNKTLHNVVGGRLGVFEGNGGDLRIGLAKQSLHDGDNWLHQPLRLTVVIDAPSEKIESVINQHHLVANLVNNNWLYIARFADDGIHFYQQGQWQALTDCQ